MALRAVRGDEGRLSVMALAAEAPLVQLFHVHRRLALFHGKGPGVAVVAVEGRGVELVVEGIREFEF